MNENQCKIGKKMDEKFKGHRKENREMTQNDMRSHFVG